MRTTRNEQTGCAPEAAEGWERSGLGCRLVEDAAALGSELPEAGQRDVAQHASEPLDDPLVLHVLATHGC